MKKITEKCGAIVAKAAVSMTKINVNAACRYVAYQPKVPAAAKKLRKF